MLSIDGCENAYMIYLTVEQPSMNIHLKETPCHCVSLSEIHLDFSCLLHMYQTCT